MLRGLRGFASQVPRENPQGGSNSCKFNRSERL
jgi:hypothetical protein